MSCNFECSCNDCENLMLDEEIIIIKQYGLSEHREHYEAVKCRRYGTYATSLYELKTSKIVDDMIWE